MVYEIELDQPKWMKFEGAAIHSALTWGFKKCSSVYKESVDSEVVLKPEKQNRQISHEQSMLQSSEVHHLHDLGM